MMTGESLDKTLTGTRAAKVQDESEADGVE